MRLFVGLDIDAAVRARIAIYIDKLCAFATDARWVRPESVHVTLKFVGERSAVQTEDFKFALGGIHARGFTLNIRGQGFFPDRHMPRVFWIGIEAGIALESLAAA